MDYFLARYYSSAQGRFTSPDDVFIDQDEAEPQSWNLYTYAANNPLRYTDPLGLFKLVIDENGKEYYLVQPGDYEDYDELSEKSGIPINILKEAFNNATFVPGQYIDLEGAYQLYAEAIAKSLQAVVVNIEIVDKVPGDSYRIEPGVPLPGIGRTRTALDTNRLIQLEKAGRRAIRDLPGKLTVSKTAYAEFVKGSTRAKVDALLRKFGIAKHFGVKNKAAFEKAIEQGLKLGLKPKDAVILATAKAQGAALVTSDKAIVEAAKKIGVEIIQ